jgi:Protein of unknown function (DUF2950)
MLGMAGAMAAVGSGCSTPAARSSQRDFATAEQAVDTLVAALRRDDQPEQLRILGPDGEKLIHSGDAVADQTGRARFVAAYDAAHHIEVDDAGTVTLIVGAENWPAPIPVVRRGERWHFDTDAAVQKILDRRVGRNELSVIEVCREFVTAQREYASEDRLGEGRHEYAQKFESSPSRHDGLYWETRPGEPQSPLGPLVAKARAQGYSGDEPGLQPSPYHGYFYRILTRQGANAPGGAKDYVVDGHMTAGFGLLAFPARWGDSGIMTFVVNQGGIVFQKNLGPETEQLARQITEYDPDPSWATP